MSGKAELVVGDSLADLVQTIALEHEQTVRAGRAMVEHAIRCGEALILAKEQVPRGEWEQWLMATFPGRTTKTWRLYMRLAKHREEVRRVGPANLNEAHKLLAGAPPRRADAETRSRALHLRAEGKGYHAIARELGVSHHAVSTWCDPVLAQKRRDRQNQQSKAAQRRATAAARAAEAAAAGGAIDDAFRKVRVAQASLREATEVRGESVEAKAAIRLAITKLAAVEDQIVRAARLSTGSGA